MQMSYQNHLTKHVLANFLPPEKEAKETRFFCDKEKKYYEEHILEDDKVCDGIFPEYLVFPQNIKNIKVMNFMKTNIKSIPKKIMPELA